MVTIHGSVTDAFTHFAAIGLASIVESVSGRTSIFHWSDAESVEVDFAGGALTADEAADHVGAHVHDHAVDSWVTATTNLSFSGIRAPLSPRLGRPTSADEWQELQEARLEAIGRIPLEGGSLLDHRFIGALGEPGYWCIDVKGDFQVDWAASALEMKTRNRGEEFIQNRLRKLAESVDERTPQQIRDGLTGETATDEAGKNALGSRTPTGLRAPSLADNAQAWCALWGLSAFPVRPVATVLSASRARGGRSVTSAMEFARGRPPHLVVPVPERPLTLARIRSLILNESLMVASASRDPHDTAAARLARLGVGLVVSFTRFTSDNVNAPERWLSEGELIELARVLEDD